jgi:hypothetical protein
MKKYLLFTFLFICGALQMKAQQILPAISVRNIGGKIIVSWRNEYNVPVTTLNIQRSYDSTKNYTTIGSVLSPQSRENGYADVNPPYNKMYYRVFIAFEGGSYLLSQPVRPSRHPLSSDSATADKYPWQVNPFADSSLNVPPANAGINFPSKRIYTARDNTVVIHLPDAATKKYTAKFYDELENPVFELTKLNEEYLIIEKVNFVHSGWYRFELYESGKIVERNKFFVPKDPKNGGIKNGNR